MTSAQSPDSLPDAAAPANPTPFAAPDQGYVAAPAPWPATPDPAAPAYPYPYPVTGQPAAPGGYAGYGTPTGQYYPGYPYAVQPRTNGLAIGSMVVSLVSLGTLACYGVGVLLAPVGAILGHVARRQIKQRGEGGAGMALAGVIVGWITTGLGLLFITGIVLLLMFAPESTGTNSNSDVFDALRHMLAALRPAEPAAG